MLKDMRESVSNSIYAARKARGMTQEELAHAAGVSRQTIIAIEKGNYAPSITLALVIARIFNTTVEDLFALTT